MRQKSLFREYVESFAIAIILALIVRAFFIQAFKIPTGSMQPTLMPGDRILVSKVAYGAKVPWTNWRLPGFGEPEKGDMVVFKAIDDPKRDFIKRLVATEGDEVQIRSLRLWIDGKPVSDPPIFKEIRYYNRGVFGQPGEPVKVPEDHYFFLGDNSASSRDSRYWGFLPGKNVIGKAFMIYWPPNRVRWLGDKD